MGEGKGATGVQGGRQQLGVRGREDPHTPNQMSAALDVATFQPIPLPPLTHKSVTLPPHPPVS